MEEARIIMNEIMRNLKKVLEKENLNKNSFNKIYFLISKNNIEFNLEFSDIDKKDIENISIVKDLMIKNSYLIADKFYNHLLQFKVIKKIILKEPSLLNKLKQYLSQYIKEFFSLNYDEDYFFNRLKIGFTHFNNGISLDIYIKSYAYLLSLFMEIIKKEMWELRIDDDILLNVINSTQKIMAIDVTLAVAGYNEKVVNERLILEKLATTDNLTNAFNRNKYDEIINREYTGAFRYGYPVSLVIIDIDNFKKINDMYGHSVGDIILKESAAIIKNNIRASDYLIRWGGDEFLVVASHTLKINAERMSEKIMRAIEFHKFIHNINLTVSIGLTQVLERETPDDTIKRADEALYKSKLLGRNKVCVV